MTETIPSPTALDRPIAAWLAHQRALGRGFSIEERVLDSLRRCLARLPGADLDQGGFDCWCETLRHLDANTRRARQMIVRRFCLFRRRTDPTCFVPDPLCFSRPHPYRDPVIVTPGQVARMLAAADSLEPTPDSPLRPAVLRIALVLLYTAGLRRGELLRLTLDDIDPQAGVLRPILSGGSQAAPRGQIGDHRASRCALHSAAGRRHIECLFPVRFRHRGQRRTESGRVRGRPDPGRALASLPNRDLR